MSDRLLIAMRVYFEKPRTSIGWKGLIMDPRLDGSQDIARGLGLARTFLRDVLDLGLPTATEMLDPITPQYIADLVCWCAIGARTTESQTHRQMASGLSMPLGFKNGTDGNLQTAINAIRAAAQPQTFLGISLAGRRLGDRHPRQRRLPHRASRRIRPAPTTSPADVARTPSACSLRPACPRRSSSTAATATRPGSRSASRRCSRQCSRRSLAGSPSIIGAMVESNLEAGSQPFPQPREHLRLRRLDHRSVHRLGRHGGGRSARRTPRSARASRGPPARRPGGAMTGQSPD